MGKADGKRREGAQIGRFGCDGRNRGVGCRHGVLLPLDDSTCVLRWCTE